jgi:hypothetical protein
MVLAAKLELISVQCDVTAAFVHARVPDKEKIHVHQPRGFKRGNPNDVLCLKRTLYGLKQAPQYFFKYLTEKLIPNELTPSEHNPCLFMNETIIVIVYVDDILIYGKSEAEIDKLIKCLKSDDIALHKEGTAEGYLGVDIQKEEGKITLIQEGLTKCIIEVLGLSSKYSTSVETPAESGALGKDVDGIDASGSINYPSIVGMLLYLGHSCPDISFATHQCARYTHFPNNLMKMLFKGLAGTSKEL